MKNSSDTIGNRTRELPPCSTVPQPTALPPFPSDFPTKIPHGYISPNKRDQLPSHPIIPVSVILIILDDDCKPWRVSSCILTKPPVSSFPVGLNTLFSPRFHSPPVRSVLPVQYEVQKSATIVLQKQPTAPNNGCTSRMWDDLEESNELSSCNYNIFMDGVAQSLYRLSYRLDGPESNPGGDEIFRSAWPVPGPTQPPIKWVPGLSRR